MKLDNPLYFSPRMRAPQKTGGKRKDKKEKRLRPPSTIFSTSDSIKAAFILACEAGHLEKVSNLN